MCVLAVRTGRGPGEVTRQLYGRWKRRKYSMRRLHRADTGMVTSATRVKKDREARASSTRCPQSLLFLAL